MLYDYPMIIVDNFFKYPLDIRNLALSLKYNSSAPNGPNGQKTQPLHTTHPNFFKRVCCKILDCYSIQYTDYTASMYFHSKGDVANIGPDQVDITTHELPGWIHTDRDAVLASIIYLTPNFGNMNFGTSMFKFENLDQGHRQEPLVNEAGEALRDNKKARQEYNQNYKETLRVGNIFNRMIAYDGSTLHTGCGYFGNDPTTSRLTLLTFFHKINLKNNYTPLSYVNRISDI